VTADHFAAAINRVLSPEMESPAAMFVADIVGADDVLAGRASQAEGVRVLPGNRLEIELAAPRPDLLARIAMPFFGAIPLDLPLDPKGVDAPPSAGPYYVASRTRGRSIVVRRNPYYRHSRPSHLDAIVYEVGIDPYESIERIERGDADYVGDGIPPEEEGRLGADYGVNEGRFFVGPTLQLDYFAMNTRRQIFGDPRVRRAVNFAFDRPELLRLRGEYAGVVTDHILPPRMRARAELPEDFKGGTAVVYTSNTLAGPALGYCVRRDLAEIGIEVEVATLPETHMHHLAGRLDEPFDGLLTGWAADYPDPFAFMNILLDGSGIVSANNMNFAYFDDSVYNRKLREAAHLEGEARYRAYADLDIEISRDAAPWVSYDNRTARDFVSSRVVGAFHHPVFELDLAGLSLE
jgi:ABC-type oligopeptide transport system substrate-binding subunit